MKSLNANGYSVYIGSIADLPLQKMLNSAEYKKARKIVLVDENSLRHCFPLIAGETESLRDAEIIEVESGEGNKNIGICTGIWEALSEMHADRQTVVVNLGGGVICDMGGFIASAYKRGIRFIHIPTTLLSQVDASVGGKVGIDLAGLKNQVGFFANPQAVFIDPVFLKTLSKREILSGFAEVIKHGLIADKEYWDVIRKSDLGGENNWEPIIHQSISIKNKIVMEDPSEKGIRKKLNFGHTIGHALESFSLEGNEMPLTHGEAVAIGMVCEAWLSHRYRKLSQQELEQIVDLITNWYPHRSLGDTDYHRLIELMRNDKKNNDSAIGFTLLESIGHAVYDCTCTADQIKDALRYYVSLGRV